MGYDSVAHDARNSRREHARADLRAEMDTPDFASIVAAVVVAAASPNSYSFSRLTRCNFGCRRSTKRADPSTKSSGQFKPNGSTYNVLK